MGRPLRAEDQTGEICGQCGHPEGAHVGLGQACRVSLGRMGADEYIICPCEEFEPLILP